MAVITKYVVVRNGVELDKVFLVKKEADAYDKMLDAAENLSTYIKEAELEIDVDGDTIDSISVFLAKNGPEVTRILKGLKPVALPATDETEKKKEKEKQTEAKRRTPVAKAKAKPKGK